MKLLLRPLNTSASTCPSPTKLSQAPTFRVLKVISTSVSTSNVPNHLEIYRLPINMLVARFGCVAALIFVAVRAQRHQQDQRVVPVITTEQEKAWIGRLYDDGVDMLPTGTAADTDGVLSNITNCTPAEAFVNPSNITTN